jgi:hypothetical protein
MAQVRLSELGDCSQFKSSKGTKDCKTKVDNMNKIIRNVDSFTRSNNVKLGEDELAKAEAGDRPCRQAGRLRLGHRLLRGGAGAGPEAERRSLRPGQHALRHRGELRRGGRQGPGQHQLYQGGRDLHDAGRQRFGGCRDEEAGALQWCLGALQRGGIRQGQPALPPLYRPGAAGSGAVAVGRELRHRESHRSDRLPVDGQRA